MARGVVGRVSFGMLARVLTAAVVAATALGATSALSANRQTTRVTIFGDSAAEVLDYVSDAKQYLGSGLDVNWELRVCRRLVQLSCPYQGVRPPTVLDVVQSAPNGGLGSIVVIDVGYNDYVDQYQSDMETVIKALAAKGVEHVIWTTLHEVRQDYRSINATIRAEAAKWPQVTIADWNAAAQGQNWFNSRRDPPERLGRLGARAALAAADPRRLRRSVPSAARARDAADVRDHGDRERDSHRALRRLEASGARNVRAGNDRVRLRDELPRPAGEQEPRDLVVDRPHDPVHRLRAESARPRAAPSSRS